MPTKQTSIKESHRDVCRRQHKVVGYYLAVYCWLAGADCVAIERDHLQSLLGLQRFRFERLSWFECDIADWFPHTDSFWSHDQSVLQSMFMSRVPLDDCLSQEPMSSEERVAKIPSGGPKAILFDSAEARRCLKAIPSEKNIRTYVRSLSNIIEMPLGTCD